MKTTSHINVERLANEFNDYSVNVFPKYLTNQLIDSKKNYNARIPHVIAMKRKARWSTEDVRQAFNYNEHNFKLIQYNERFISIFQSFIEMTQESELDVITRSQRIRFSKDCIMKLYRIIAIYKATILTT
ncbi:hypothetical protein [Pseudomonas haemolytica]|jgi:hypothetical protein|uniref:Uncharacterized protein n=1 Tax=Pseudomonas haemolytica TaxID=2600065 RepID=A0ABS1H094_9PSED|nr:hypothetical protein [Pseudomonas haemolytica]MBK3462629.1 hypothetical protein [Pseudomonas haemolytica]